MLENNTNKHTLAIKWYDLNKNAQRRLLNSVFGTKSIAEVEFEEFDPDDKIICEIGAHGDTDVNG